MLTPEQVQRLIEDSMPSIIAGFKEELRAKISWQVQEDAAKIVSEAVSVWIKENIIPEIHKVLTESKEGFISLAIPLADTMTETLCATLMDSFKKKMENSWDRKKVMEAMFV